MTKLDIAERISRQRGISREEILAIIDAFLEYVKDFALQGERIELRGFGSFYRHEKKGRTLFSPIAGREIAVPPKTRLAFRPSKLTVRRQTETGA